VVTYRRVLVLVLVCTFTAACVSTDGPNDNRKTTRGATIGAVAGAIVGAVVGNQSGDPRTGAIIGAAAGAAIGGTVGRRMDRQEEELRQIEGVEVTRSSEGEISLRLTSDVLFDYNSAALRPESRSTLNELADNFSRYPDTVIIIEGHTDSIGSESYNQRLSEDRAGNVADYLIDNGVPARSITLYGYGELRPRATNETAEGRQLNRRVEIHIRALDEAR
jgi:outer membrane protein OmpA-like peptidoglycan-associated protein